MSLPSLLYVSSVSRAVVAQERPPSGLSEPTFGDTQARAEDLVLLESVRAHLAEQTAGATIMSGPVYQAAIRLVEEEVRDALEHRQPLIELLLDRPVIEASDALRVVLDQLAFEIRAARVTESSTSAKGRYLDRTLREVEVRSAEIQTQLTGYDRTARRPEAESVAGKNPQEVLLLRQLLIERSFLRILRTEQRRGDASRETAQLVYRTAYHVFEMEGLLAHLSDRPSSVIPAHIQEPPATVSDLQTPVFEHRHRLEYLERFKTPDDNPTLAVHVVFERVRTLRQLVFLYQLMADRDERQGKKQSRIEHLDGQIAYLRPLILILQQLEAAGPTLPEWVGYPADETVAAILERLRIELDAALKVSREQRAVPLIAPASSTRPREGAVPPASFLGLTAVDWAAGLVRRARQLFGVSGASSTVAAPSAAPHDPERERRRLLFLMDGALLRELRTELTTSTSDASLSLALAVVATEFNGLVTQLTVRGETLFAEELGFERMSAPEARLELRGYLSRARTIRASETQAAVLRIIIAHLRRMVVETIPGTEAATVLDERVVSLVERLEAVRLELMEYDETAEGPSEWDQMRRSDATEMASVLGLRLERRFLREQRAEQGESLGVYDPGLDEVTWTSARTVHSAETLLASHRGERPPATPHFFPTPAELLAPAGELTTEKREAEVVLFLRYLRYYDLVLAEGTDEATAYFINILIQTQLRRIVGDLAELIEIEGEEPLHLAEHPTYREYLTLYIELTARWIAIVEGYRGTPLGDALVRLTGARSLADYLAQQRRHLATARRRLESLNRPTASSIHYRSSQGGAPLAVRDTDGLLSRDLGSGEIVVSGPSDMVRGVAEDGREASPEVLGASDIDLPRRLK
ncbi:MAG: hypothetical protein Q7S98_06910 [Deltaproteobacteria bacterium]|nr:hypothetical protein [Deltaproteobacteria bacterium]